MLTAGVIYFSRPKLWGGWNKSFSSDVDVDVDVDVHVDDAVHDYVDVDVDVDVDGRSDLVQPPQALGRLK